MRDVLVDMRDVPGAVIHPQPFQQLRGEGGGYMADMMKSVMDSFSRPGGKVKRADAIEGVTWVLLGGQLCGKNGETRATSAQIWTILGRIWPISSRIGSTTHACWSKSGPKFWAE